MLDAVDIVTAYRTCPHIDLYERGAQAGELPGRRRWRAAPARRGHGRRPMITPADLHDSGRDPFRALMALADAAEADGALAAGVPAGAAVAGRAGARLEGGGHDRRRPELADPAGGADDGRRVGLRHAFLTGRRPDAGDGAGGGAGRAAPCVIGDAGDATNAGTPGDSTVLLRAALRHGGDERVLLAVRDEAAAREAHAAGVGAEVALMRRRRAGRRLRRGDAARAAASRPCSTATSATASGRLRPARPSGPQRRWSSAGGLQVVGARAQVRLIDPALFEALGIDVAAVDVLQAKSHVSYKAGLRPGTERSVVADTPAPAPRTSPRCPTAGGRARCSRSSHVFAGDA